MNELQYAAFQEQEKQRLTDARLLDVEFYNVVKKDLTNAKRCVKVELWLLLSILCYIICITGLWLREVV